jgi:hypothetical protein
MTNLNVSNLLCLHVPRDIAGVIIYYVQISNNVCDVPNKGSFSLSSFIRVDLCYYSSNNGWQHSEKLLLQEQKHKFFAKNHLQIMNQENFKSQKYTDEFECGCRFSDYTG